MYWSRSSNLIEIAQYVVLAAGWGVGGWLLVTHVIRLRTKERLMGGLAAGLLLFTGLANLFANQFSVSIAFWLAGFCVFSLGILVSWRSKRRPWLNMEDLRAWPQLAVFFILVIIFAYIQRGLSLFDEYLHVPLTSIMAAGDIPPHFYLNPSFFFAYHYGIHILAASLVRLGTLMPWSALDLSKAVMIAFTFSLGWLWVKRVTRSYLAGFLGSILISLGGGTRWLLMVLPSSILAWVSNGVQLVNTGSDTAANLITALSSPWIIEGDGAVQFPFAFHNGIFVPVIFQLGSTGAMPHMTIILLLLLAPKLRPSRFGIVIFSLIFATLALSAEHLFALLWIGIALAAAFSLLLRRHRSLPIPRTTTLKWGAVLAISAVLAIIQGGFITESVRSIFYNALEFEVNSFNTYGFSLRWPPALLSGHLGSLSIFDIRQLIVLLAVLGPALMMVPFVVLSLKSKLPGTGWYWIGLGLSAVLSLLFPLIVQYGVDRSITRMPLTGMWTFLLMGFPLVWYWLKNRPVLLKVLAGLGYLLIVTAGIVILFVQVQAIPHSQYTYFIDTVDTHISSEYWDNLPEDAQVFDNVPHRAVALFGRSTRAYKSIYRPLPDWEALIADPHPIRLAAAGYDYVYFERSYWLSLTSDQKKSFQDPCIDTMLEEHQIDGDYRVLMDIRACAGE